MHRLVIFLCLIPIGVLGSCSCSQSSQFSQTCSGDSQWFLGTTELFVGDRQTCDATVFTSSFNLNSYNSTDQAIELSQNGVFQVQGDMIIPQMSSNNITVFVSTDVTPTNATFEIFGNLIVNGITNITVDNIIVHGNVFVSGTGQLSFQSKSLLIYGNFNTQGNVAFVGTVQNAIVSFGGSFVAQNGAQNIAFVGCVVSFASSNTSQAIINAPGSNITIGALSTTIINATVSAKSVTLRMDPIDQGQSNFRIPYHVIQTTSPINFPVTFEQGWVCGDYKVNATISTTSGVTVTFSGNKLVLQDPQYCCFEGYPAACQTPTPTCNLWICDQAGFIVGWVIGGVVAAAVLITSCTLFARDFMAVVSQK